MIRPERWQAENVGKRRGRIYRPEPRSEPPAGPVSDMPTFGHVDRFQMANLREVAIPATDRPDQQASRRASCCYTFFSADNCSDYEYECCCPSGLHVSPGLDRLFDRYQGDAEKPFTSSCLLSFRLPLRR